MKDQVVHTPASLLLSSSLPASARLLWMVERLRPASAKAGTAWLCTNTGLARTTVLSGLAQLTAQGWLPAVPVSGATVPVPGPLLTNRRLSAQARVLYGILLLTPGYCHPSGRFSYAELADLANTSRNTLAEALAKLVQAEWIKAERAHRLAPIHFELTFPGRERGERALAAAQRRLNKKRIPYGEALMREYLSLLIQSDAFEDNAFPGFLLNPRTRELLQFDRYYPPDLAFEYNGPQHYRATQQFTPEQVAAQRERDLIKMGICIERGITVIIVQAEDLTLAAMQQKVANLRLPLRDHQGYDQLIEYLESESRTYRRKTAGI